MNYLHTFKKEQERVDLKSKCTKMLQNLTKFREFSLNTKKITRVTQIEAKIIRCYGNGFLSNDYHGDGLLNNGYYGKGFFNNGYHSKALLNNG